MTTAIGVLLLVIANAALAQSDTYAEAPINYMTTEVHDPVAQLAEQIASGQVDLEYDEETGYLPALLKALDVPTSSQTLVFSKTSLQLSRISPRHPRAVYFNDDVYVGYCHNGDVLELAATDAKQGATFYTLSQDPGENPEFVRDQGLCLSCHSSHRTQDVPGYLVRSVFSDRTGRPILGSGTYVTDHTSDFTKRWGGWYVTGDAGRMAHMGNTLFNRDTARDVELKPEARESLNEFFDTDDYLTPHSDVVALMVMEHQSQMHNALAAANYESRRAVYQSFQMNEMLDRPEGYLSDSCRRRLDKAAERVVKHLFFYNEFPLEDQVKGNTKFAEDFAGRGSRDSHGRSLRDFDLTTRLFKYPCSYLIEAPAFDSLPDDLMARVKVRIQAVLDGSDESSWYAHLTPGLRDEIRAILGEIKPEVLEPVEIETVAVSIER